MTGVDGVDRSLLDKVRTVKVGKALAEIDRIVLCRKAADFGEYGFTEWRETAGDLNGGCGILHAS
jgi:hypothetical protein